MVYQEAGTWRLKLKHNSIAAKTGQVSGISEQVSAMSKHLNSDDKQPHDSTVLTDDQYRAKNEQIV